MERAVAHPVQRMEHCKGAAQLTDEDRRVLKANPKMWSDPSFYVHYMGDAWKHWGSKTKDEADSQALARKVAKESVRLFMELLREFIMQEHPNESELFIANSVKDAIPYYLPGNNPEQAISQTHAYLLDKLDTKRSGVLTKGTFLTFFTRAHKELFTWSEAGELRALVLQKVRLSNKTEIVNEIKRNLKKKEGKASEKKSGRKSAVSKKSDPMTKLPSPKNKASLAPLLVG
jgi:hypothetical protein